jgi:flagellar motor switch protein FliG
MAETLVRKQDLTPDEKIAVLLASMEQKVAAAIVQQLDNRLMVRVTNALRMLGVVPGPVRERTLSECLREIQEFYLAIQGDENLANSLLVQAVGEKKAAALMEGNETIKRLSFSKMAALSPEQITSILAREPAGIIAIVFRYLPSKLVADTMELLPSEVRRRVMVHMCTAAHPAEDVVLRIEALLNSKIATGPKLAKMAEDSDPLAPIASMLQHAKKSVEEDLLSAIQEKSEAIATQLRDLLFTFDDIVRLSDTAIRRLMQEVDTGTLAIALRNANMDIKQKFFQNMSKRAATALQEDMQFSQKVRRSEIEAKQKEIVGVIRALEADGKLSTGAADDYV